MNDFANRYLLLLDPEFIKIITDLDGNVISFIIAMPDISKGIIACDGRVIPFGIFQIIHARKKAKQLNLLLGGIKKEYRGKGLDVIMGVKMLETARKHGLEYIDSHLELETNTMVRKEMERMNGKVYKRFRVYRKEL
jgi:predicted GNAT family acetyltransferase